MTTHTGIWAFCGTILLIAILTLCVIHKISEKWRIDHYKLRVEAIKHESKEYQDIINFIKKLKGME